MWPMMVTRGSKTAPDDSLQGALTELQQAQQRAAEANARLDRAQKVVRELSDMQSEAAKVPITPPVPSSSSSAQPIPTDPVMLADLIGTLKTRVEHLERKSEAAAASQVKSNEAVTRTLKQLACGGIAGAVARTIVAPLDRVKILKQTQFISSGGTPDKYTSILQSFRTIVKEEGVARLWRGNITNIVRVVPYAATQFASYDAFKQTILDHTADGGSKQLNVPQRLLCGAFAGATATSVTHPLDVIRLRLSIDRELKGSADAFQSLMREGGVRTLFKGYVPTLLSVSPFIAINFATFDFLKSNLAPVKKGEKQSTINVLGLGAAAGLVAQSVCYPLDTVRRRMQMKGQVYTSTWAAFTTIAQKEGFGGFYKGMTANAIKVVPNNAIRFVVYEFLKQQLGIQGGAGEGGAGG